MKSDERILGDSDFVEEILARSEETLKSKYKLKASGVDLEFVIKRVADILEIPEDVVWHEGKQKKLVLARSLLCFWTVRELGESMTSMARRLNISTVAVSKAVARGGDIIKKEGYKLIS